MFDAYHPAREWLAQQIRLERHPVGKFRSDPERRYEFENRLRKDFDSVVEANGALRFLREGE